MPEVTTRSRKRSAAEIFLDRKISLIADYSCEHLFAQLANIDRSLSDGMRSRSELLVSQQYYRAQIEETKTLASLGIEGKNEAERAARKVEILRLDQGYQAMLEQLANVDQEVSRCDQELDEQKRNARRVEREIGYRTAILDFLGG